MTATENAAALSELVRLGQVDEEKLRARWSPEERAQIGSVEHWAPKETIAHLAYWKDRQATRLMALAAGAAAPEEAPWEQVNDEIWQDHAKLTWDEAVARSDSATERLLNAIQQVYAGQASVDAEASDALASSTFGNSYGHVNEHFAYYYADRGDGERAVQVRRDSVATVVALRLGPTHEGAARYNLACFLALSGRSTEALDELRQACALRPDLAAYAVEDPDLTSLRADQAFQALTARQA